MALKSYIIGKPDIPKGLCNTGVSVGETPDPERKGGVRKGIATSCGLAAVLPSCFLLACQWCVVPIYLDLALGPICLEGVKGHDLVFCEAAGVQCVRILIGPAVCDLGVVVVRLDNGYDVVGEVLELEAVYLVLLIVPVDLAPSRGRINAVVGLDYTCILIPSKDVGVDVVSPDVDDPCHLVPEVTLAKC